MMRKFIRITGCPMSLWICSQPMQTTLKNWPMKLLLVSVLSVVWFCTSQLNAQTPAIPASNKTAKTANSKADELQKKIKTSIKLIESTKPKSIQNSLPDSQQKRVRAIQEQIQLLKGMMDKNALAEQNGADPKPANGDTGTVENSLRNVVPPRTIANPASAKVNANLEPKIVEPPVPTFPLELTKPIDSRELANSLFLSGNLSDARKKYELYITENSVQTADDPWAFCALANCLRQTGEKGIAEAKFRDVAAMDDGSLPFEVSKWYLDHLSKYKEQKDEFDTLIQQVDSEMKKAEEDNE